MNGKASCERQNENQASAVSAMRAALPRITSCKSQVTNYNFTHHRSPITLRNHAFLIDIWRLEMPVTRWKHTMRVRSNRHVVDTPPRAVCAARNVVSAPRRVLASRFSALGVPSLWRNPRVHREHPPGGGIGMLIPMHRSSCTVLAISTRNAYPDGIETGKRKLENGRMAAASPAIFTFRFSNFHPSLHRGET
jgi:hypothetical protein